MIPLTPFGVVFAVTITVLLFVLPRRWAAAALLAGACYMVLNQGIKIGPFHLYTIRLLILAGLARVLFRGERPANGLVRMDGLMLTWAAWAVISSAFRNDPSTALTFNLGLVFNSCGAYFLLRTFLRSTEDVVWLIRALAILLVPVAGAMVYEQLAAHNLFSILGGVPESPAIRNGRLRSQGPFAHAILAGTVGAVFIPVMMALWWKDRKLAVAGLTASTAMVFYISIQRPAHERYFCHWRFGALATENTHESASLGNVSRICCLRLGHESACVLSNCAHRSRRREHRVASGRAN